MTGTFYGMKLVNMSQSGSIISDLVCQFKSNGICLS